MIETLSTEGRRNKGEVSERMRGEYMVYISVDKQLVLMK